MLQPYYRQIKVGDSEGLLGPDLAVLIVRPFTAGEDAVMLWLRTQDDTNLVEIVPMTDGRDYIVFERLYTKQSRRDAYKEADALAACLLGRIPTQHGTNDTLTR